MWYCGYIIYLPIFFQNKLQVLKYLVGIGYIILFHKYNMMPIAYLIYYILSLC